MLPDPNTPERKIPRSIHEDARDLARDLVGTPSFEQSRRNRKRDEMLFAHSSASYALAGSDCAARAAHKMSSRSALSAQNLRRLAKLVARPPSGAEPCPA